MRVHKIILDLDDTLNSCTMFLLHAFGCNVGSFDYDMYPTEVGYDIVGAWSKLCGRSRVDSSMFWEWAGRRTWEMMPRSGQFWLIEEAARIVGKDNVLIATSPTKSPDCLFGKYQWMENHLPDWMKRQYAITPRKQWFANSGVLLIDDCGEHCDAFSANGGESILLPRPWNSNSGIKLINTYLRKELDKIGRKT